MPSPLLSERTASAVDEVTPLLTEPDDAQPVEAKVDAPPRYAQYKDVEDDTPLPKTQIFLLCYARVVEPVAFFTIFPFINKMLLETGNMKEGDVGFYTGLIVYLPFLLL